MDKHDKYCSSMSQYTANTLYIAQYQWLSADPVTQLRHSDSVQFCPSDSAQSQWLSAVLSQWLSSVPATQRSHSDLLLA